MNIVTDISDYNKLFNFGAEQLSNDFYAGRFGEPKLSPDFTEVKDIRAMFYVITIFKQGALDFTFSSGLIRTSPCMVLFKSPFHLYSVKRGSDIEGYYLQFTPSFVGYSFQSNNFHRDFPYFWNEKNNFFIDPLTEGLLTDICEKILAEQANQNRYSKDIIASLLRLLLFKFNAVMDVFNNELPDRDTDGLLHKFYEIVNTSTSAQRSVEEMATKLNVTADHLWNKIKKLTGQTPSDIMNQKIIADAKSMLLQSELSVSEISYQLNFKEHAHFTRFFKNLTGFSPTEFIRQSRK